MRSVASESVNDLKAEPKITTQRAKALWVLAPRSIEVCLVAIRSLLYDDPAVLAKYGRSIRYHSVVVVIVDDNLIVLVESSATKTTQVDLNKANVRNRRAIDR